MVAAPFEYLPASSWQDAVELLEAHGEDAKVIAGGQSLVPMMTLRLAIPATLIDVGRAGAPSIEREDGKVVIGALTRHVDLEHSSLLAECCPIIPEAAGWIGNLRVRHRGTIGGSLAHADPSAELGCVVVALGGTIRTLGPAGVRRIPATEFFESQFTTALDASEVVTAVELPVISGGTGWSFQELVRRRGDFAIVEVAALIELDTDGRTCRRASLVAGAVGARPVELLEAAAVLAGESPERVAEEAGRRAARAVDPSVDVHASSDYRREMLALLTSRAVLEGASRARRGESSA
jgi:CO/xanthine dehydrogenase FAD-binding subunit